MKARTPRNIVWLLATLLCCQASETSVFERGGRIMLRTTSGKDKGLTDGPSDLDPWLSLDSRLVVFCRAEPGDEFQRTVHSIEIASGVQQTIFSGSLTYDGQPYRYLAAPQIDQQSRTLYVLVQHSVTTGALFSIELDSLRSHYLAEAAEYQIVRSGPQARHLLLNQRRHDGNGVHYEWSLFSSAGKLVRLVSSERLSADSALRLVGSEPN
jgi:hypothetical protein